MGLASDLVGSGGSVDWDRLGQTAVGAFALVVVEFVIGWIDLIRSGIVRSLDGLASFWDQFIGSVIGIPISTAAAASREIISILSIFGPFAFVVAIGIMLVSGYILFVGTVRSVQILRGAIA